jgi:hypothetical protein
MRSEALKKAQIKYREKNREKINEYFKNYQKQRYTEDEKTKKANYYQANKERIKAKYFEDQIFTGFRKLLNDNYR